MPEREELVKAVARAIAEVASAEDASVEAHPDFVERAAAAAIHVVLAELQADPQADKAAEILDYWASRNGAFAISSVKAANRASAREAWLAVLAALAED